MIGSTLSDIPLRAAPDTVLIGVHGLASHGKTTRRWHGQQSLVDSVRARMNGTRWCRRGRGALVDGSAAMESNGCKPLRVMVRSMEGLSFCEQASLYARSKVVFVHHGASLANGLFLRRDSLMVELNKQWAVEPPDTVPTHSVPRFAHTFDGAGYSLLFISSGVAYVGARVTYGVWPKGTSGGYNEGGADPMTGAVQWQLAHASKGSVRFQRREDGDRHQFEPLAHGSRRGGAHDDDPRTTAGSCAWQTNA